MLLPIIAQRKGSAAAAVGSMRHPLQAFLRWWTIYAARDLIAGGGASFKADQAAIGAASGASPVRNWRALASQVKRAP